jgi:hypothetical protein
MSKEVIILVASWILTIFMLIVFVPKHKFREAQVIFFFKQLITWLFGLTVVQFRLIEYPVREFSYASRASFAFEFFIYPAICVVFNLHYPEGKSKIRQFMYFFYFCTTMTVIEVLLEKYSDVINYLHWNWFLTWITLFITFYITRKYYLWFFGIKPKNELTTII